MTTTLPSSSGMGRLSSQTVTWPFSFMLPLPILCHHTPSSRCFGRGVQTSYLLTEAILLIFLLDQELVDALHDVHSQPAVANLVGQVVGLGRDLVGAAIKKEVRPRHDLDHPLLHLAVQLGPLAGLDAWLGALVSRAQPLPEHVAQRPQVVLADDVGGDVGRQDAASILD